MILKGEKAIMTNKTIYANKCCVCGESFATTQLNKEICDNCKIKIKKNIRRIKK